jgi:hypothetical protein
MHRIREHMTYANGMATLAVFIALGLGGTALASVIITNNNQVAPNTISGHKPPSGKHANLIGGSVNGQDVADNSLKGIDIAESTVTGNAHELIYNANSGASPKNIATVGPYTLKGQCFDAGSGIVEFRLFARGPAGTADYVFDTIADDNNFLATSSSSLIIPASTDTQIARSGEVQDHYVRIAGTEILKSGSTLIQVDFNAVGDGRTPGSCFLYGTATRAT